MSHITKRSKDCASPPGHALARLASRARDGDQEAFRDWLHKTHGIVYRLALRMLGDAQGAEDVTQEVFTRAWQNMARLKKPEASLGWVCRITRNVATDRLRHPSRREVLVLDKPTEGGGATPVERLQNATPDPELEALSAEERTGVRAAVAGLKPKLRMVLLLREVDDLSYDEIATALGIPRGTVESRIHRARAKVKTALERAALREARSEG